MDIPRILVCFRVAAEKDIQERSSQGARRFFRVPLERLVIVHYVTSIFGHPTPQHNEKFLPLLL